MQYFFTVVKNTLVVESTSSLPSVYYSCLDTILGSQILLQMDLKKRITVYTIFAGGLNKQFSIVFSILIILLHLNII